MPEKSPLESETIAQSPQRTGRRPSSPGRDVSEKSPLEMTLIGSDVVALFPSITAEKTSKIVRKEIENSEIKFEGMDTERARAYIVINIEDTENLEEIEHLLPKRKSKTGIKPTMTSIGRSWKPRDQWEFPEVELTNRETSIIVGVVVEIALKVLFNNFTYKFGGKFFHQKDGGPIGVRATGAAAQLVMESWARDYRSILEKSGLLVSLMAGYVDDGRQVVSKLDLGMRFCADSKKFQFSEEGLKEDEERRMSGESENQRMARLCTPAMNSINSDLRFTTESQEDFQTERLPTLDFEVWIENNKIRHSYYQKPMKTPFVLMFRSGMSYRQKFQILTNELSRRLSNIQIQEIPHKEVMEIIEQF